MTGEGVQQHYARQEEWQRLFAARARQWAISAGRVPADASREVIDRAVSEALLERGVSRGASPSSVKKWRTGRFAPPPTELLAVVEQLFGTGDELGDLLASITPDVPGNDAEPLAGPAEATGDGRRPAGPDGSGGSGSGDDRSTPGLGSGPDLDLGSGSGSGSRDPASAAYPGAAPPRRSPRRRALAVAAVLAAAVLVAGALFVNRRSPGRVAAGRDAGERPCRVAVGSLPGELSSSSSATRWREEFADAYREAGGRAGVGCPTAPVERWGRQLLVQTLPGPVDGAPGALVVVADDPALRFHFNAALWASYRRIGTRDGTVAQPVVGIPLSVNPHDDGHVEVELEPGLLVAEQVDAPYFSIPLRYIDWWRANKDHVGLPMGNPRPGEPRQDTERGHATVTRNAPEPTMHPSPDPSAELPAQVGQGEVIISQPDGTNWWIPTAGHRQWIADRATWRCLGGAGKTVSKDVPGAAVATLEYTGIATCED